MLDLKEHPDGYSFRVRVIPKAHRNSLVGLEEGVLVVRLAAPPVDGKANEALLEFLARRLGLRRRSLQLQSGEKSRHKVVKVEGVKREALEQLANPESED